MVVAEVLAPRQTRSAVWWLYQVTLVLCSSALIALFAQISFYLPFTPVPITGQTFGVLLIGALLGRWRGALTVIAYLSEGISGLPVFAGAGCGAVCLFGPTGGYLAGFVPAAFLVGMFAERGWDKHVILTALAMLIGSVVILTAGVAWLSVFVGHENVLAMGLYPFLIGDVLKIAAAAVVFPSLRRLV